MARAALDLRSLNQCKFNQYGGPFQELWGYLPTKSDLKEVNRIAAVLKEKVLSNRNYTPGSGAGAGDICQGGNQKLWRSLPGAAVGPVCELGCYRPGYDEGTWGCSDRIWRCDE